MNITATQTYSSPIMLPPWKLRARQRIIKWQSWEYWPINVVYFLPALYFLWLCARYRAWFFFSASNPGIPTGGMFFEAKWDIYQRMPKNCYPKSIYVDTEEPYEVLKRRVESSGLTFPIIAKPNRGERGWGVKILRNFGDLSDYRRRYSIDFLLQAYVDYPMEWSVFYKRMPNESKGKITSLTEKVHLQVLGDGNSTLEQLVRSSPRATLHYETIRNSFGSAFFDVVPAGEKKILVPYGNHCRGALFLDRSNQIDHSLGEVFDRIAIQIDGFYFGRFDLKAQSLEDLREGKNFSIVELNGSGAEPAHIYQPGFSFWKGQATIMRHFKWMSEISAINMRHGAELMTWSDLWSMRAAQKSYRKRVKE